MGKNEGTGNPPMITKGRGPAKELSHTASSHHPTPAELPDLLSSFADDSGSVPAGVAGRVKADWSGEERLLEILEIVTATEPQMGYLAGGRRPVEVAASVMSWFESSLSVGQIRMIVACGGWDPDPFAAVARAGLLESLLYEADGSRRRVKGELAGAFLSDEMALADDAAVLESARALIRTGSPDGIAHDKRMEVTLDMQLDDAEAAVRAELARSGFGVLTEIDVAATLRAKLGVERTPLKILGACNPSIAHRALELDPSVALFLPCNVVFEQVPSGTHVSIADPRLLTELGAGAEGAALEAISDEAALLLSDVIERLESLGAAQTA